MTDRDDILANIRTWTAGGVTVNGAEDQARFQQFYNDNPEFRQAFHDSLRERAAADEAEREAQWRLRQDPALLERMEQMRALIESRKSEAASVVVRVTNPLRMSAAIDAFVKSKNSTAANSERTLQDKKRLLLNLCEHVGENFPQLTTDPWVHELQAHHLSSFADATPVRKHRRDAAPVDGVAPIAAATATKKLSDLRTFFSYVHRELKASNDDISQGLVERAAGLKGGRSRQRNSYAPFNDGQLKLIFEPRTYLAANRTADYFWAPLLGLHLGMRLGEIVTLRLDCIERDKSSGIWSIQVEDERAKTGNSVRRVPVHERLIELGFADYVEYLNGLGATQLFPHRNLSNPTTRLDPSKRCSEQFGEYLDAIGIVDTSLVFHSFRHTVVTALQDGNTPLGDSMQIVGHATQDFAQSTGRASQRELASVHLAVYGHADAPRMNVADPLVRLKGHLHRCVTPPLDYGRLRVAADIVTEHVAKSNDSFTSGWPKLREKYTAEMLERLGRLQVAKPGN